MQRDCGMWKVTQTGLTVIDVKKISVGAGRTVVKVGVSSFTDPGDTNRP
ncbi:Uncharacterised protein [Mycobacteroides abscessus subsp. abscessus]|nr:Uncharacterised protein [Mycobacteroides abscessus subsp. abscessus]SHU45294.1 Uncharacterised protein [Mycobacteroides abscessus subsp. abscessus]SIF40250.1 Uncharacterised protein [Mycobacteroides abscessus subsp. abscessus]SIH06381.1 Uncharacterised protein [Mycobacteroides abscessus subsp. abscessus]SIK02701.1 Uncharacterised protein [Mycobacteroides abscessus subsp. abscessus]